MATYSKKVLRDGRIRYSIQAKIKDNFGQSKFVCTTWKNDEGLTGVRAEKAAIAFGEAWESDLRNGNVSSLANATFNQISNIWLETRKHNMSDSYYLRASECIVRFNLFFGNKKFTEIKAYTVQQFFVYLNEYEYQTITAKVKDSMKSKLNDIATRYGIRKAGNEGQFSRPTLYYARIGDVITWESAKLICNKFGLNVNEYFEKVVTCKPYKKETIMKYRRVLSAIFNYAISIELVTTNYASSVYLKNVVGGKESEAMPILSESEINSLLKVLENHKIIDTIPIYLLALLGLRSAEVCGLEWQDIDFENRLLYVRRNRVYIPGKGIIRKEVKTKKSKRDLYINDLLLEKLTEFKNFYDGISQKDKAFDKSGALFCNYDGTPKFPHYLNHLLKRYLAEENCQQVSCHKIRHTWISLLIGKGVNPPTVSKMAGHSSVEITLKVYTHYCKDKDNSKAVLDKLFSVNSIKTMVG